MGEPEIHFIFIPTAKGLDADMMEFTSPETEEIVGGRKSFKHAEKSLGWQTLRKQINSGSKQKRINPTNVTKKLVGHLGIFLQNFLVNHVKQFSVPFFLAVSGTLGGKVPVVDDVLPSH